jgi:hypothetical protein
VHSIFAGGSSACLLELVATVSIGWSRGLVAKWSTFVAARRQTAGFTVLVAKRLGGDRAALAPTPVSMRVNIVFASPS